MKTSKRDNVDISNLMQSIDQTEKVNVETEKLPDYIGRLSVLAKKIEEIANSFDELPANQFFLASRRRALTSSVPRRTVTSKRRKMCLQTTESRC